MSICVFPIVKSLNRKEVDQYLKDRISEAFIKDKEKLLPMSLLALQEHPIGQSEGTIQEIRTMFATSNIPFKPDRCYHFGGCCGNCGKACSVRCIQDILQKLQLMCNSNRIIKMQLEDNAWITYDHVITLLNDYMKGDPHGRTHYCFDYSPAYEQFQTKSGKYRPKAVNGEWCIHNWPTSGLCPYCIPNHAIREPSTRRNFR